LVGGLLVLDQVYRRGVGHVRFRRINFRRTGRRGAGQQLPSLIADDHGAILRREAADQADFLGLAVDRVPGDVKAVRVAQLRLAVVLIEILGGKYVLPVGTWVLRVTMRFVEGVDRQSTFDLDRLAAPIVVEHHSTAKATFRHLARLGAGRVGPECHQFQRTAELPGILEAQRLQVVHEIELRAARYRCGKTDDDGNEVFHAWLEQQKNYLGFCCVVRGSNESAGGDS